MTFGKEPYILFVENSYKTVKTYGKKVYKVNDLIDQLLIVTEKNKANHIAKYTTPNKNKTD